MVQIDLVYSGELRTSSRHVPSGAELHSDAPLDNHGRGESFSPTDLVATAFGSCMLTVMGIAAQTHGWRIEGARAEVHKHMSADLPRRISRLVASLDMPPGVAEAAKVVLEETARNCPVAQSLSSSIEIDLRFHWRD